MIIEQNTNYAYKLKYMDNPTFDKVRNLSTKFYRELNALVVVELKTGDFKSSYLGQLMSYLSILDAKVKKPHENPSIGIVLCKSAKRDYVEFVIRDYNKPMGVATYKTTAEMPEELRKAMPDIEELKKLL